VAPIRYVIVILVTGFYYLCVPKLRTEYQRMTDSLIEIISSYIYSISDEYGVNPLIFAFLYFSTVPLFWISVVYLGKHIKQKKPLVMPLAGIAVSQLLCYIYLFSAGHDLPIWAYAIATFLIIYTLYMTWLGINKKLKMEMEQP